MRGTSRTEEEFLADWTIGFVLATFAVMICVETAINTHATIMAVLEILGSPNPTKSAVRAMIGPLIVGHPEIANVAMVLAKLNTTFDAIISTN
jgi:hypothetical protein